VRWSIVLVLCGTLGLHNGSRIGPSSLVEELRARYDVEYAGVGNVIGAYTMTYAVSQLSAGVLTDRYGSRRLLLVGLGLMSAGAGLFALAPSYTVGLAGRMLMGVAGGFLYTPAIAYCFAAFDRRARGKAMGLAQSGTGAGLVLSLALMPLLYQGIGLTGALLAYPLVAITLFAAVWLHLPAVDAERKPAGGGLRALVRIRDFWLLLIGYAFLGMLAQTAVLSWLPTYLRTDYGFDVVTAGLAGGLVAAGLMVFPSPFGLLADRIKGRRVVMQIGCGLGLAGWLLLLLTREPYLAIVGGLLVSASMAATIPMQAVYASERFAVVGAGTAVGLINTGGQIAQSLAGPLYGALLDGGFGFGAVWATTVVLGLVRVVVVQLLREPAPDGPSGPAVSSDISSGRAGAPAPSTIGR
jgi:predicted MFS family arabinose efflux permease